MIESIPIRELFKQTGITVSNDSDSLEWILLLGQLKNHMKDGPDSSEVQRIIGRMNEKSAAQFQDEECFAYAGIRCCVGIHIWHFSKPGYKLDHDSRWGSLIYRKLFHSYQQQENI